MSSSSLRRSSRSVPPICLFPPRAAHRGTLKHRRGGDSSDDRRSHATSRSRPRKDATRPVSVSSTKSTRHGHRHVPRTGGKDTRRGTDGSPIKSFFHSMIPRPLVRDRPGLSARTGGTSMQTRLARQVPGVSGLVAAMDVAPDPQTAASDPVFVALGVFQAMMTDSQEDVKCIPSLRQQALKPGQSPIDLPSRRLLQFQILSLVLRSKALGWGQRASHCKLQGTLDWLLMRAGSNQAAGWLSPEWRRYLGSEIVSCDEWWGFLGSEMNKYSGDDDASVATRLLRKEYAQQYLTTLYEFVFKEWMYAKLPAEYTQLTSTVTQVVETEWKMAAEKLQNCPVRVVEAQILMMLNGLLARQWLVAIPPALLSSPQDKTSLLDKYKTLMHPDLREAIIRIFNLYWTLPQIDASVLAATSGQTVPLAPLPSILTSVPTTIPSGAFVPLTLTGV